MDPIDDHVLADFLAKRLTPARRAEVIRHLAENEEAREKLRMSYQALEAVTESAHAPVFALHNREESEAAPSAAPAPRFYTLRNVSRVAAAVALLIASGATLRLVLGPPADQLRTPGVQQAPVLAVEVLPDVLAITWGAVSGANTYDVIVWDQEAAREVASTTTSALQLPAGSDFARTLREALQPGHTYTVRVTAFDAQNRSLLGSDLIPFRYAP